MRFFELVSELDVSDSLRQREGCGNSFVVFSGVSGFREEKRREGKVAEIHNKVGRVGIVPQSFQQSLFLRGEKKGE